MGSEPLPNLADIGPIANEANLYGFLPVNSYRTFHSSLVDRGSPELKGGWNEIDYSARVFPAADTAILTSNFYDQLEVVERAEAGHGCMVFRPPNIPTHYKDNLPSLNAGARSHFLPAECRHAYKNA